jgi:pyruvate,water dikinase
MSYTIDLNLVSLKDINLVGGKNASLGEMIQNLKSLNIKVPGGFAITTDAYFDFIEYNKFNQKITSLVSGLDDSNLTQLREVGSEVRQLIRNGEFPDSLKTEIKQKYLELSHQYGTGDMVDVAVRSSATAEDLPDASFAGQQETFLNVRGSESILEAVRNCFASLFTDRAISYRNTFGYNHFEVGLSVCIQKMVRSDMAASGVAFSLDPESGFKDVVVVNGSYGLGEMVVQGSVSPDEFIVFKPSLEKGFSSIIEKKIGYKDKKMIYGEDHGKLTKVVTVSEEDQNKFSITDQQALQISKWVMSIEKYY